MATDGTSPKEAARRSAASKPAAVGVGSRAASNALLYGFTVTARDLGKLHVHGAHDECKLQLESLGGVRGLATKLSTNLLSGVSGDDRDLAQRREAYGPNVFPEPPFAGFWALFFESFKDVILLILIAAAIVSFVVGLIDHPDDGWIDGVAIVIAILLVAFVTALNNYKKELQFRALRQDANSMVRVRVLRNGVDVPVAVADVVVGDVLHLETGDKVIADGIYISGSSVKTDEAALTGESDNVAKDTVNDPFMLSGTSMAAGTCNMLVTAVGIRSMQGRIMADTAMEAKDTPLQEKLEAMATRIGYFGFLFAILTFIAMIVSWFADNSNLKGNYTQKQWIIHAVITSVTIIVVAIPEGLPLAVTISLAYSTRKMLKDQNLIRVLAACETMGNATDICSDKTGTLTENRMTVVQGWLGGSTVAFPAGGVKFNTPVESPNASLVTDEDIRVMMKDHLSVNSTVVVSWDEQGRAVVRGSKTEGACVLLVESMGYRYINIRGAGTETQMDLATCGGSGSTPVVPIQGRTTTATLDGVTSATFDTQPSRRVARAPVVEHGPGYGAVAIARQYPFTAERKMMSTLVALDPRNPVNGPVRLYVTGASEFVLRRSTNLLWLSGTPGREDSGVLGTATPTARLIPATPGRVRYITETVIEGMAKQSLRTLGLAYRDFGSRSELPASWMQDPDQWRESDPNLEEGLVFYGVLGIKDPLRPDVKQAVADCHRAGINVRMITGDNVTTARAIAKECGIITSDKDLVIEGPVFRRMTPKEVDAILPRLKVMARSSPRDKNMLVRRLNGNLPRTPKEWEQDHISDEVTWDTDASMYQDLYGPGDEETKSDSRAGLKIQDVLLPGYVSEWEAARKGTRLGRAVVGVTGDGTNDAPALKAADVGLSMGITGTQVAKDASDIVILDDRFSSIVRAVIWGRSVYDNIRKFLQFQLSVNVVAVLLVFISAVSQREPPLAPVQLLWVNLIMDTMGALALGTETPSITLLDRKPYLQSSSIISRVMMRNLLFQSAYQLAITLWLVYEGKSAFGIDKAYLVENGFGADQVDEYLGTFIFNTFVICQLFNEFNARSIGNKKWVFYGLHKNPIFMAVIAITIGLQIFIVEVGGKFTSTTGLTLTHWGWSILLACFTTPLGVLMRFVPVKENPASFADYYSFDDHKHTSLPMPALTAGPMGSRDGKIGVAHKPDGYTVDAVEPV